jgi:uncharacterized protein
MAPAEGAGGRITVVVAYSPAPRQVEQVSVTLTAPATVADALRASGLLERHPEIEPGRHDIGVWGKLRAPADALRDGDRVELYRPLKVDPKEARRQRQRSQRGR